MSEPRNYTDWDDERDQWLKRLWKAGGTITTIARDMGTSRGSISGRAMRLHLHFAAGSPAKLGPGRLASIAAGRTVFQSKVQEPGHIGVLKLGANQRKLGARIEKGPWKGLPIYSLTLEERATCPKTCLKYSDCMGNQMGYSIRYRHGPALESAITNDLRHLSRTHPVGFVVRLHILGDFPTVEYVEFWRRALAIHKGLRVFGYTAWPTDTPIGAAVAALRDTQWSRFAVRTSGAKIGPRTLVIASPSRKPAKAIICPAQTHEDVFCGSCCFCWLPSARDKPVAFLQH